MEARRHTHTYTHIHTYTQDLAGALSLEEIKDALKLDAIQNRHWQIVSCSAVRLLQKKKIIKRYRYRIVTWVIVFFSAVWSLCMNR
jgi:hypothetical protein